MPWKKRVAREWLKFIGIALLSLPLGLGPNWLLDNADIIDIYGPEDLVPGFLIMVIFIYCIRFTVWSIKYIRQTKDQDNNTVKGALTERERMERDNLKAAIKMAARSAKIAMREGNKEGLEKGKAEIRALFARAKERQDLRNEIGKLQNQLYPKEWPKGE